MEITKEILEQYIKETKIVNEGFFEITDVTIGAYKVRTPNKVDNKTVRIGKVRKWFEQKHKH